MFSISKKINVTRANMLIAWISLSFCALFASTHLSADNYDNEWENVPRNGDGNSDEADVKQRKVAKVDEDAEEMLAANTKQVRRFHEVLDELLAEFGYDVRMGQLNGLKNLAIRKVDVSDALPDTYRTYVEMLISERIRENSRVRLVSCVPCRTKTSHLVEGKLMITSPTTNLDQMKVAANQLGIDNFMDVVLVYHTTHMVLALQVFNTDTQEMMWTRTYNSETVRSRFQKLAVDYKQVEKSRPGDEYEPDYRFLVGLGGGLIPNVNNNPKDNGMIALAFRGTERFDNRKHEFGLHFNLYLRRASFLQEHDTNSDDQSSSEENSTSLAKDDIKVDDLTPWSVGIALYGLYGRHFVGSLESYNQIRHGANAGLGFIAATGYIAATARTGWDVYFGKRFATNLSLIYIAPSTVITSKDSVDTKGGIGADFTISFNF